MFTRERHRRGVVYFGPYANAKKVRETLDVLNRVFQYRPCEGPKPGRHSGIPCLDFHIERCLAPCVGYISKEDYARDDRGRDRVPLRRHAPDPARARAADARGRRRGAVRGRGALPQPAATRSSTSPSGRRADRRAIGTIDVIGVAADGDRAAVQVFPLRGGKMIDRYGFHLENVGGPGRDDDARAVLPRVLRLRAVDPAADRRPARRRPGSRRSRSSCPSCAARASRCARRSAARSGGSRSSRRRTRGSRSTPRRRRRSRSGCAASRRSRSCARRSTSRACRSGSSASTSRTSRASRSSARWSSSRTRSPKKAHYRKFGVRGLDGQDDFAAMAEVISRRFARLARRRRARSTTRGSRRAPNLVVIDGGKGQLSAALAAMQAYDLPRVAVIALAKRERGGVRAGPRRTRSCSTRTPPGLSCCSGSATRRTASRSASTASAATRRRASRCSTSSRASAPCAGGRCCGTSARPSGRRRRAPEELEGVPGLPAKTARADLRAAAQGRAAASRSVTPGATLPDRVGRPPRSDRGRSRRCARGRALEERASAKRRPIGRS